MRLKIVLIGLFYCLFWPGSALASNPDTRVQHTAMLTITVPELDNGPIYYDLITTTNELLEPIDEFAASIAGTVSEDPETSANDVASNVAVLWQYLSYLSDILPGLLSFSVLIVFYLTVLLVKVILSAVKYIKQLVAQWV